MSGSPRSEQFDDIYFAVEDGFEETRHVFLAGNRLPERWQGRSTFTIAETGFGTGLNILSAWLAFEQTSAPHQKLQFISVEKYPLSATQIAEYLSVWRPQIGTYLDRMLELYPARVTGWHTLHLSPRVSLLLMFDDANRALPELDATVDAWFLDGHAPAKNPEMWSDIVFEEIGRLSAPDATCATFTASGVAKRGLRAAGFEIEKRRGFGRKRDMIVARRNGKAVASPASARNAAVIGAGLAGTSVAHALKMRGIEVDLYEKAHIAAGASGNPLGLFNPRFSAQRSAESDFYGSAYALALRNFRHLQQDTDIGYHANGSLHLMLDDDKTRRFSSVQEQWEWHDDHLRLVGKGDASTISGVQVEHEALYLPDSGVVSPQKLCQAQSARSTLIAEAGAELREDAQGGWVLNGRSYDAVVIANGAACLELAQTASLPLHTVRGQISFASSRISLQANLCYGGYCSVGRDGLHTLGSTFQPWLTDTALREEDHIRILETLAAAVPSLEGAFHVTGGRAALRTAAKDRIPVGGAVPGAPGLYISTAHGSHGLLSSQIIAELIAAECSGQVLPLPRAARQKISAARFLQKS